MLVAIGIELGSQLLNHGYGGLIGLPIAICIEGFQTYGGLPGVVVHGLIQPDCMAFFQKQACGQIRPHTFLPWSQDDAYRAG